MGNKLTEAQKEYISKRKSFQEQRQPQVRKKYKAMLKRGYASSHVINLLAAKYNCTTATIYNDLNILQVKKEVRAMLGSNP